MSERRKTAVIAITLIVLVLLAISGCGPSQETVSKDGEGIFQNLYVPPDAGILNQHQMDSIVASVHGCKGMEASVIYGINRPTSEVLSEYIEYLFANGWYVDTWNTDPMELPHFYKGNASLGVYFTIPLDVLKKFAVGEPLQTEGYSTIYLVDFSYAVPPNKDSGIDDCWPQ